LHTKFLACAERSLKLGAATKVLDVLRTIETMPDIAELTHACSLHKPYS
jgi:hypothetical protein